MEVDLGGNKFSHLFYNNVFIWFFKFLSFAMNIVVIVDALVSSALSGFKCPKVEGPSALLS